MNSCIKVQSFSTFTNKKGVLSPWGSASYISPNTYEKGFRMLPMLSLQYLELEDSNYSDNGASESVVMIQHELWWFFYLRKNFSEETPALC